MRGHAERIVRHPILVLIVIAIVTVILAPRPQDMRIVVDPDELLPYSHPFQTTTTTIERVFGSKYLVVISLTARSGTVFQPSMLARVKAITVELTQMPGVIRGNILSLAAPQARGIFGTAGDDAEARSLDVRPLMTDVPTTPEALRALEQAYDANPVYQGLLVSRDRRTTAVVAEVTKDPGGFRVVAARFEALAERHRAADVEILVSGQPLIVGLIEVFSDRIAIFFPIALVVIGLIHWEAFRSIQAMILPLVTALLAVVWSFGLIQRVGVTLDTFNATTPILILTVAAGHAVQILKRYYECYLALRRDPAIDARAANRRAVVEAVTSMGPIMIAAGTIAAVSFSSLLLFEVHTIQVFGIFTALGIVSAVIIELTFTPALRALLPPPADALATRETAQTRWDRLARRLAELVIAYPVRVVVAGLLATLLLCGAATLLRVDNATSAFLFRSVPVMVADRAINERLAGTNTFRVLVEGEEGAIKDPRVLQAMEATQRFLEREPQIGKTVSIVDFLVRINAALNEGEARLPDSADLVAQYLLLYSMAGDPGDFDRYVDFPYQRAVITAYMREESSAYLLDLNRRLTQFMAATFPPSVRVSVGGTVMQAVALNEVMVGSKLLNMAQIAACVFAISALLFRSLIAGLLVLMPLGASVAAIFGVMGLTGIPLQMATATVSALAVGIGADYAIYFLYRLRDAYQETGEVSEAIRATFASAGKAVMFVATAVAGGYAVLTASWGFLIYIWLGALIAMAMAVSATSALTVMPALALLLRPRFLFGAGARQRAPVAGTATKLTIIAALVAVPSLAGAQALTADQVMERNFVTMRVNDSTANITFRLINPSGQERVRQAIYRTLLRENHLDSMRSARFMSPADIRGTVVLMIENLSADDDMWIYLPAARRVRRLAAANRKDSFVGSDFTYGDIIGHRVADWTHRILREEAVDGRPAWVVESQARTPQVRSYTGYSRRVQWIDRENFVAVRGEAYDEAGQLLRRFSASDIRLVDPAARRWQPMTLEAHNVQTNYRTIIRFENFRANQGISPEIFTTRAMERDE
jgi:predicted RND superfamily exporter protein/outer membrane lipoprotein-sorting protein